MIRTTFLFTKEVLKTGLVKIPAEILKEFSFEDGSVYPFELNVEGQSARVRVLLRCSSGSELFLPVLLKEIFVGKEVRFKAILSGLKYPEALF